jgi:hypothetical protein
MNNNLINNDLNTIYEESSCSSINSLTILEFMNKNIENIEIENKNIENIKSENIEVDNIENENIEIKNIENIEDENKSDSFESITLNREYKYIKDEKYQKLYNAVELLLESNKFKKDFLKIIPLLMIEVNLFDLSLKGNIKKEIVCEFLNYILEDNESPFYHLIECDNNTRELLIIICPFMIDIVFNISKYGLNNKKYKKYDINDNIDDNELIDLMVDNTKDLHFDSNKLTKKQIILKMCSLIIGLITFLETNNMKKINIILIVLEKFIDDKELLNYGKQILNLLYDLIISNLQIISNLNISKCECNCFSYFF